MMNDKDPNLELSVDLLENTFHRAMVIYRSHYADKGLSWQTCDFRFLRDKMMEEHKEVLEAEIRGDYKQMNNELLDLVNIALMMAFRTSGYNMRVEPDEKIETKD